MKTISLFIVVIFFITGCSSKEAFFVNRIGQVPKKNEINVVYTGDAIYKKYNYNALVGANLLNPYFEKIGFSEIVINPQDKFHAVKTSNYIMYCSNDKLINQIGTSDFICLKDNDNDKIFDEYSNQYAIVWSKLSNIASYEVVDIFVKSGFKYEIFYNGISNNTLHLEYREYINDIARPSFYQNLQYEFKNEKIQIRYKDIKMEIYEVNNNSIKYSIIE